MRNHRIQTFSLSLLTVLASLGLFFHCAQVGFAADEQSREITVVLDCSDENLIVLGYKYGSGANPYTLKGKCVKLHNVKAIQYFDKDKALASWSYRGNHGVVYLEAPENQELVGDARSLVGMCVGVYSYNSVLDNPSQVPHIIVSQ